MRIALLCGLFFFIFTIGLLHIAPTAYAEEPIEYFPEDFPFAGEASLENLEAILASPDFGAEREGWGIRVKSSIESRERPDIDLAPWLEKIRQAFGFILRLFVVFAISGFLGFAFYWFLKNKRNAFPWNTFRNGEKSYVNPHLPAESPESLFAMAEDFFAKGLLREAWASCLAGCIGAYSRHCSISFPAGTTEYGCLDMVRQALPSVLGPGQDEGFAELVQSWVFFAYGGRMPAEGAFERALAHGRSLGVHHEP